MAKTPYGLPTLYGNQYGQKQKYGFGNVLNPFNQPPQGTGQGSIGKLPLPQPGQPPKWQPPTWNPPGTNQPPSGNGTATYTGPGATPFGGGAVGGQAGGGAIYQPTPPNYITASYAYKPRQMPGDTYVNTSSAAYKQSLGAFSPSADNQKLWEALPQQYQLSLNQWAAAGAGAYSQAYLDAMRAGSTGVIFNGQYMAGNDAAALIQQKALDYMNQIAQARQQNKPRPQPTPFYVGVGQ